MHQKFNITLRTFYGRSDETLNGETDLLRLREDTREHLSMDRLILNDTGVLTCLLTPGFELGFDEGDDRAGLPIKPVQDRWQQVT